MVGPCTILWCIRGGATQGASWRRNGCRLFACGVATISRHSRTCCRLFAVCTAGKLTRARSVYFACRIACSVATRACLVKLRHFHTYCPCEKRTTKTERPVKTRRMSVQMPGSYSSQTNYMQYMYRHTHTRANTHTLTHAQKLTLSHTHIQTHAHTLTHTHALSNNA